MLVASSRLGPYEIVAPLGAGGMGEVYRARDTRLGREVAIKVLPEPFANSPDRLARFEREARAVAALSHPNILAIHDYGTQSSVTYAVMELLEGETLRDRLKKGPLPWREAVEIGAAIADGLAAAHAKGIIHRDLKPENLFLTADGRVKILDFGLARIEPVANIQQETSPYVPAQTDAGVVLGTAGYMAPEQVRGQSVDARSDLFSFGCVLYEMLTGRRAFQRETAAETMTAILHDEPADATTSGHLVPVELGRLIRQCLAKSPSARLQSARDLALGLRATASDPALQRVRAARRFSWRLVGVLAAVLVIGVVGASVYLLTRSGNRTESGKPAEEAKAIEALAVLPFENVDGSRQTEHLSEGIPDTIIHRLSRLRLPDLKVRSLLSVAHYKGRKPDLEEIRRELGVGAVITGRVQQRDDRLIVSVALTDVRDGSEIWGDEYDRKLGDILALQDRIAKDIAAHLRLRLTAEEERRLARRDTENSEAYQLYSKGRFLWNKRTREGLETAIKYFEQATKADPTYALAWAGLADVYAVFPDNTDTRPSDSFPKAKAAAIKALEIDDHLAEAHATLALITTSEWNWSEGNRRFQRAIELDPNNATARKWYGQYLTALRRFDEAEGQYRRAQELDPLSLIINVSAGECDFYAQRYDAAIEQYRKTLEMDRDFWVAHNLLGQAYIEQGMYEKGLAELQHGRRFSGGNLHPLSLTGRAYALMGRRADALKVIEQLRALSHERYVPPCRVALVYASLGENEQALDWLDKAYNEQDGELWYLKVEPAYKGLHSEPRYLKLLERVGLADKAAERDQGIHSVAVLPFVYDGGDPKVEMLSETLVAHIIDSLAQVRRRDLKIRPLSSVSRYKRQRPNNPAIGRALNVPLIVTGTLQQRGDGLTIIVEVVDAHEDNLIGRPKQYSAKLGETVDLDTQDQIVRDVAARLGLQLTDEEQRRLTQRHTTDPDAYRLYQEAIYHFNKFRPEELQAAIKCSQQALAKDPKFPLAYVALGRCYILLGSVHEGPMKRHPEAKKYLAQARDLDPSLPDVHSGLAAIHMFFDWNWSEAERELKQAIALDPNMMLTWNIHGFWLASQDRLPEALVSIQRGQSLDPLAAARRNELAMCYNWMRRYDDAIREAEKALELDRDFPLAYAELGLALVQRDRCEKAIGELKEALNRGYQHPRVKGMLGYAYAVAGKREQAQKVLEELKVRAPMQFGIAYPIARVYAALGEKDQAFEWLQKACNERDSSVIWLKVDPMMDSLRKDPRFASILQEMHLSP